MARTAVTARLADVAQPEKWAFQVLAVPWVRSAPPVKTVVCMARRALLALQDTIDAFQIKYMFLYGDSVDETRALVLVPPLLVPSITPPLPPHPSAFKRSLWTACRTQPFRAACASTPPHERLPTRLETRCKWATPGCREARPASPAQAPRPRCIRRM